MYEFIMLILKLKLEEMVNNNSCSLKGAYYDSVLAFAFYLSGYTTLHKTFYFIQV